MALTLTEGGTHHVEAFRTKGGNSPGLLPPASFLLYACCCTTHSARATLIMIVAGQTTVLGFVLVRALRARQPSRHKGLVACARCGVLAIAMEQIRSLRRDQQKKEIPKGE